jgi:hypothetical protein
MGHRLATWAIVIWSGAMALAIFGAFLGIGGDCVGLTGSELSSCQSDAWARGTVGLGLLGVLWFIFFAPLAIWWSLTRPKGGSAAASAS